MCCRPLLSFSARGHAHTPSREGFGCFTLLDFADSGAPSGRRNQGLLNLNPNPPTFYRRPLSFQVDTRTNVSAIDDVYWRLFGQGTSMTVSAFKVAYEL